MPCWDFKCPSCGAERELWFRSLAQANLQPSKCPACGNTMERQPCAGSFVLKGTGFYVNDYKDKV